MPFGFIYQQSSSLFFSFPLQELQVGVTKLLHRSFPFQTFTSTLAILFVVSYSSIKNRDFLKLTVLFLATILVQLLILVKTNSSMYHHMALAQPLLIIFISKILNILLQTNRYFAIMLFLVISISMDGIVSNISSKVLSNNTYAHYQTVYTKITKSYFNPIVIVGNCSNISSVGWESKTMWFFDKNRKRYILDTDHSQIDIIETELTYVCTTSILDYEQAPQTLSLQDKSYALKKVINQNAVLYHVYKTDLLD